MVGKNIIMKNNIHFYKTIHVNIHHSFKSMSHALNNV